MSICEHFIYTSSKTSKKIGYQVILKSKGITERILSQLKEYHYPIGIKPKEFKESCSLIILDDLRIAFSIVKNIGIGYDGRDNTLYNHTFIMKITDFEELNYDSRVFYKYFIDYNSKPNELESIVIPDLKLSFNMETIHEFGLVPLRKFLESYFEDRKIAISNFENKYFIQELLSILPMDLKLNSFSTNVVDSDRQNKFNIIQIAKQDIHKLNRSFFVIDFSELSKLHQLPKTNYELVINYISRLMLGNKSKLLNSIFKEFESISGDDFKNKLLVVGNFELLKIARNKSKKEEYALECFRAAEEIGENTAYHYYDKTRNYLRKSDTYEYEVNRNQKRLLEEISKHEITYETFSQIFNQLEKNNQKTRIEFLHKLVNKFKTKFITKGEKLLIDTVFSYSYYNEEIIRVFLENPNLHPCVHRILKNDKWLKINEMQNLFERLLKLSLKFNPEFIPEIIGYHVYNLIDSSETLSWKWLIQDLMNSLKFNELPIEIIISISHNIRLNIQYSLKQILKPTSKIEDWDVDYEIANIISVINLILSQFHSIQENRQDEFTTNLRNKMKKEITLFGKIIKSLYQYEMKQNSKKSKNYHKDPNIIEDMIDWFFDKL